MHQFDVGVSNRKPDINHMHTYHLIVTADES